MKERKENNPDAFSEMAQLAPFYNASGGQLCSNAVIVVVLEKPTFKAAYLRLVIRLAVPLADGPAVSWRLLSLGEIIQIRLARTTYVLIFFD